LGLISVTFIDAETHSEKLVGRTQSSKCWCSEQSMPAPRLENGDLFISGKK